LLQEAIAIYQQVLKTENVPDALVQATAERCIDRMRFRGLHSQAVSVHKLLINKFPHTAKFANHLAVTYLTINKINEARKILNETLTKWPNDGFALVHYGFILKTNDDDLEKGVKFLQKGISTKEPGVIDGRFYFHLGDALTRLGKKQEAVAVYEDGVKNKVFLSKYQRSLYNVERLTGKPWWKKEETPYTKIFNNLERNWMIIRDEGLKILDQRGYFKPESENLRDVGDWKQFELFARGIKNVKNCKQCPVTCSLIETFHEATQCRRGQIKFSVMHPGTHVWPHCGPTNCRLRAHLGLKVPLHTYIRVAEEIRSWKEGKFIIFDDSFEHEVWHNGTATRLVLIVDFWHPELTKEEKRSLSSI